MTDNSTGFSIKNLSPEKQKAKRDAWRDTALKKRAQIVAERNGTPYDQAAAMKMVTCWRELRGIVALLKKTVDERPARFTDMLKESLPRLRTARANLKADTEPAQMLGDIIGILELMERRIWR